MAAGFSFVACGGGSHTANPSGLATRVLASQSVSSPSAAPGLLVIDGANDTLARGGVSAGTSPGLMIMTPNRATLLAFDSATNNVGIVNTQRDSLSGSIPLGAPTTSMVALDTGSGYAAVPAAAFQSESPTVAIEVMNLT
jgi:hypothetical protein